jgi:dienelactone hydrolase
MKKNGMLGLLSLMALYAHCFVSAQTQLKIDTQGVQLDGYFFAAKATKAPAIVALHGCGGMLNPRGRLNLRTLDYGKLLSEQGWHVLFLDSFTARGVKSVCGGTAANNITPAMRVPDVQAAIRYLAFRNDVDADRLGILGWSHGGSVTLLANEKGLSYSGNVRAAVAFYPGCGSRRTQTEWSPARPILMQLGAIDDWTDPAPCQRLTARWEPLVQQDTHANAGHGFDSDLSVTPIHLQTPKGTKTVHVGGDAAAKATSQSTMIRFFQEHFQ